MGGRSADARNLLDAADGNATSAAPCSNAGAGFVGAWSDELTAAKQDLEPITRRPRASAAA